jgi:hypothetical protein
VTYETAVALYCILVLALALAMAVAVVAMLWDQRKRYDLDIRSTNVQRCARCGERITNANDSGWEVFVTGNMTQPVCKACDAKSDPSGKWLEDEDA